LGKARTLFPSSGCKALLLGFFNYDYISSCSVFIYELFVLFADVKLYGVLICDEEIGD
jgi:hypothetical protein